MKKRSKAWIGVTLLLTITLTGCGSDRALKYNFDDTIPSLVEGTSAVSNDYQADFLSDDLCVVPLKSDQGDDAKITGISSLLFDTTTKDILYADNIYEKIYPASLTKLMTALIVLEQSDLTQTVTVSHNASHIKEAGAKLCGLKEGDQIVLKDLLTALLVYSGNDAGIAIAEQVAGSEESFADLMNNKAKSLGAVDTHFVNAHGLHDENHYTTAYDLYLIFNALLQYDEAKEIINMPKYMMKYKDADGNEKEATYTSTNKYLKEENNAPKDVTVIGGKTGTTNAAGNCLELLVEGGKGNNYIALVLKAENSDSLYKQMNELLGKIK